MVPVAIVATIALIGATVGATLAVTHHDSAPSASMPVHGQLILTPYSSGVDLQTFGDECSGPGGYTDVVNGAEVTIADDTGKTLAITQLGQGEAVGSTCVFTFAAVVPEVPFYGVTVTHRGTVKFTKDQMQRSPTLTLGS
ncbi:hypothetical protein SAMN05892883_2054 [Jatrophihabitans sp. GAS493]|nr:hypothetical protein SAMN05892883_2054 [Jatrophihabitans sp. GAS493]